MDERGVSPSELESALGKLELRIVREIQKVRDAVMPESRVREIVRHELGESRSAERGVQSRLVGLTLFFISISTFLYTFFR